MRNIRRRFGAEPLEAFMGLISLSSGLSYVLGAPVLGSIEATLPPALLVIWGVYLLIGGAAIIGGVVGGFYRLFILGLLFLAAGIIVYAIVIWSTSLPGAQLQAAVDIVLAAALAIRAYRKGSPWIRL